VDTKRLILFFVISAAIMLLWSLIWKGATPPKPPVTNNAGTTNPPPPPAAITGYVDRILDFLKTGMHERLPEKAAVRDDIVLATKHLRATFTNVGAGLRKLELLDYPKPGDIVVLLESLPGMGPSFALEDLNKIDAIGTDPWAVQSTADSITFEITLKSGLKIRKHFTMVADKHLLNVDVGLVNDTGRRIDAKFDWHVARRIPNDSPYRADGYLMGFRALYHGAPSFTPYSSVTKEPVGGAEPERDWYGVRNRYFAVAVMPRDSLRFESGWRVQKIPTADPVLDPSLELVLPVSVAVEREQLFKFGIYGGPLEEPVLRSVDERLVGLSSMSGGCFLFSWIVPWITKLLIWLMVTIGGVVKNFGVAIILTTLAVRLALFPLSRKSQISMAKYAEMQKALKPKMDILQKKYADAPDKMRQAQMELFKEHGMSLFPVAGCLPILLQLPVFIGMYSVFDQAIALRHQPFFGWITDLSESDHLLRLGGNGPILWLIPYDGWLNLLPIIMTLVWFLQSYVQPKSPDPQMAQQQKIMLFMPVFFGLMCYTLASGLSLYFLVNSLCGLAEQKLIKKLWLPKPDAAGPAPAKT